MSNPAIVKFDGGARPNPGPAAIGCIVETGNQTRKKSAHIVEATNNQAEYQSLIQGLKMASEMGCETVRVRGDSKLVVKQVDGDWDVNDSELQNLHKKAKDLQGDFRKVSIKHVSRENNWEPDELVDAAFTE